MNQKKLPEKILRIKDCTFVLPEDFNGSIEDAFNELLKYRINNVKKAKYVDELNLSSTFNILVDNKEVKFCGQYAIYELENDKYIIVEATNPK